MGLTYANIEIQNAEDESLLRRGVIGQDETRQMTITAMVDTGAIMMCINETIRIALDLPFRKKRRSQTADGRVLELDVVGPIIVRFMDRECLTSALVLPDDQEPLLGAIPMEEMDLYVHPARNEVLPVHPDGAIMSLRGVR